MSNESAFFIIENITGKPGISMVKRELDTLAGINSIQVKEQNQLVAINYDSSSTSYDLIENYLNKLGYQIVADASNIQTR